MVKELKREFRRNLETIIHNWALGSITLKDIKPLGKREYQHFNKLISGMYEYNLLTDIEICDLLAYASEEFGAWKKHFHVDEL